MTVTPGGAFVTGATGYTGRAVVEELRQCGIRTIAHVRPDSPRLAAWHAEFQARGALVDATPWVEHELAKTLSREQPAAVFALLGTTRHRMRSSPGDSYESVDYGLTAMLLRAVQRGAPAARFVYLSAAGAGPHARGAYLRARSRFEQELRASGTDWIIARPALISGPDRDESRPLERIAAAAFDAALRLAAALGAGGLRARYASIDAAQLARALVHHAFHPASSRTTLDGSHLR